MRDVEVHVFARGSGPGVTPTATSDGTGSATSDGTGSAAADGTGSTAGLSASHPDSTVDGDAPDGGVDASARTVTLRVEGGVTELGALVVDADLLALAGLDGVAAHGGPVAVGDRLFAALFTPAMTAAWRRVRVDDEVRLRLVVDDPEVARLPLELLHDPEEDSFLALGGPLVRDLNIDGAVRGVTATPPVRVLVAVAGPDGVEELDGAAEVEAIQRELQPLVAAGRLEVSTLDHATVPGLLDALREDGGVDVLHLVGHGRRAADGTPTVVLEDDWHGPVDVSPGQLRDLVADQHLSLVFLNVCGALRPGTDGTDDFARALVHGARVPALVGMQTAVADDLAVQVARDFYAAIADLRPVDVALTDARRLIGANDPGVSPDIALPVCWLRSREVALLTPVVESPAPWWRWPLDHPVPGAAAVLATLASLVVLWQVLGPLLAGPEPMGETGFNVAVADFTGDPGLEGQASELAAKVHDALVTELDRDATGLSVELRGPTDVGTVVGDDDGARASAAEAVAADLRADVVVSARLEGDANGARFVPTFWIADRRLLAATELTGAHALGPPERFRPAAVTDVAALEDLAVARTRALADLVAGLSLFATGDPAGAGDRFDAAADVDVWGRGRSGAVLEVFRGKAAAQAGDLDAAEVRYEAALAFHPDGGRARYGLAEVAWDRARGSCTAATVDADGLAGADEAFAAVPIPTPDDADLEVKVDYARGRLALCQQGAGLAARADATTALRRVVAAHADGNERVRGLAGLADGLLAVQAWQLDGRLDEAVPLLEEAATLATTDAREAVQWETLACLHLDRDDPAAADDAFAQAIDLVEGDQRDRIAAERARGECDLAAS